MEQPESLRSLLISYQNGQMVLPESIVVESLPFATPLSVENAPLWVVGAILWRARTTPLVSFDALLEGVNVEPGPKSRIIVINAIGNDPKLPNFCLLGTGIPRLLELERSAMVVDEKAFFLPEGALASVRIQGETAVIPDLDFIENTLSQVIRRRSA